MKSKALIVIGSFSGFCFLFALGEIAVTFNLCCLLFLVPLIIFLFLIKDSKLLAMVLLAVFAGIFCGLLISQETSKKYSIRDCQRIRVSSDPANGEFLAKGENFKAVIKSTAELSYGDILEACNLKEVSLNEKQQNYYFNKYRSRQVFYLYGVKIIENSNSFLKSIYDFKKVSSQTLMNYFERDNFALARGLLFGGTDSFSKEMKENFKNSGTSHIVAVSGYNITIILIIIFINLRRLASKNIAGVLTIFSIITFAELTGMSASVVRASIMGVVYIMLKFLGRSTSSLLVLSGACSLMIIFDPYMISDVGFQLSALATLGIILFSDKLMKLFGKIKIPDFINENLSATLSAQFFTLPVLASLGNISVISPIANILILPIIPLAMLLVFITLIGSYFGYYFGFFISVFSSKILDYINFVIRLFGQDKFAFSPANKLLISLVWLVVLAGIIYLLFIRNEKTKNTKNS